MTCRKVRDSLVFEELKYFSRKECTRRVPQLTAPRFVGVSVWKGLGTGQSLDNVLSCQLYSHGKQRRRGGNRTKQKCQMSHVWQGLSRCPRTRGHVGTEPWCQSCLKGRMKTSSLFCILGLCRAFGGTNCPTSPSGHGSCQEHTSLAFLNIFHTSVHQPFELSGGYTDTI